MTINSSMMDRKILISIFFIFLSFFGLFSLKAEASSVEDSPLTEDEKQYLINILKFSEVEVDNLPVEVAKDLVKKEAKIIGEFTETFDMADAGTSSTLEEIEVFAISDSDMTFRGKVLALSSSSVSGYDAFYAYVNYDWLNRPYWKITDKITIGFPDFLGAYMTTSNGKITGHHSSHWVYNTNTRTSTTYYTSTTPTDSHPSAGVSAAFDLYDSISTNHRLQGQVSQYFYVKKTLSGKANVRFEYGHQQVAFSPNVSIFPSGLGIAPAVGVDIKQWYESFEY